jgi:hypothetical protein
MEELAVNKKTSKIYYSSSIAIFKFEKCQLIYVNRSKCVAQLGKILLRMQRKNQQIANYAKNSEDLCLQSAKIAINIHIRISQLRGESVSPLKWAKLEQF